MNVLKIVAEYLDKNGFDGLFRDEECACTKEDLAPCGEIGATCEAGYLCACDCGDGHDYHIGREREVANGGSWLLYRENV